MGWMASGCVKWSKERKRNIPLPAFPPPPPLYPVRKEAPYPPATDSARSIHLLTPSSTYILTSGGLQSALQQQQELVRDLRGKNTSMRVIKSTTIEELLQVGW